MIALRTLGCRYIVFTRRTLFRPSLQHVYSDIWPYLSDSTETGVLSKYLRGRLFPYSLRQKFSRY